MRASPMISLEPRNSGVHGAAIQWRALPEPVALIEHLARAQQRLGDAQRCIERQRAVIEKLKSRKRDTRAAEALLRTFEGSHAQLRAAVTRLREYVGTELSWAR